MRFWSLRWCLKMTRNILVVCLIILVGNFVLLVHYSYNSGVVESNGNLKTTTAKNINEHLTSAFKLKELETNQKEINSQHPDVDWIEVTGTERKLFLYSAWNDTRSANDHHIRIIAISQAKVKKGITCHFYNETNLIKTIGGEKRKISEAWSLPYHSVFLLCPYPKNMKNIKEVSVQLPGAPHSESRLPIQAFGSPSSEKFMAACIKPFHYMFNRAVWVVEFIEFHRLMGVEHFFFYNHTIGEDLEKVLMVYQKEGVITVLPWTLPVKTQKEIRTEGIFSALNDCNLRSVGRFKYTLMIDVDEFIVPRKHDTYNELIAYLGDHDVFIFKNVFFYLYWENDTAVHDLLYQSEISLGNELFGSEEEGPYLLTAYKTTRITPHKHGVRSKYFNKPSTTIEAGNHVVWKFLNNKKRRLDVSPDDGLSHHYRICEYGGFDCLKLGHYVDRRAHRWLFPLVKRVSLHCQKSFPLTGLCPPAPPLGNPW